MTSAQANRLFPTDTDHQELLEHSQGHVRSRALERIRHQYPWRYAELTSRGRGD